MSTKITATHERVDDIPAIIAPLKRMSGATFLAIHFPTNGHWQGLSLGETTVVWLAFSLSEGDHRLYRVEPWVKAHRRTLRWCLGNTGKPRALTEDRLATILDSLGVTERWGAFERALNPSVLRVYDLPGPVGRVDPTTAAAYVTPAGMLQLGHRKDHRPELSQVKSAMAVLDPLGLPWTLTVVAGQTADDPRYLPEIAQVRQSVRRTGLTYVGDGQRAALGTRAEIVAPQDDSLWPLSAKQLPEAALDNVLAPVLRGALEPRTSRLPNADGVLVETDDPVALGFPYTVALSAPDHSGQTSTWHERRLVVRSRAFATSQEKHVRQRVARAVTEINALDARKPGQPRVPDEVAAHHAAAAIVAKHRVEGLVHGTVTTDGHEQAQRRYGMRPATTVRREHGRVRAASEETTLAQAIRRLGWRIDAPKHPAEALRLAQGVAAYRSAYLIERGTAERLF